MSNTQENRVKYITKSFIDRTTEKQITKITPAFMKDISRALVQDINKESKFVKELTSISEEAKQYASHISEYASFTISSDVDRRQFETITKDSQMKKTFTYSDMSSGLYNAMVAYLKVAINDFLPEHILSLIELVKEEKIKLDFAELNLRPIYGLAKAICGVNQETIQTWDVNSALCFMLPNPDLGILNLLYSLDVVVEAANTLLPLYSSKNNLRNEMFELKNYLIDSYSYKIRIEKARTVDARVVSITQISNVFSKKSVLPTAPLVPSVETVLSNDETTF